MAVALLLGWGGLNVVIGVIATIINGRTTDLVAGILVLSPRADAALFGGDPRTLVQESPALFALQRVLLSWLSALITAFGLLVIAVVWFGLRRGEPWALVVLTACWVIVLAGFGLLFKRYVDAGVSLSLADLPPLFHYPLFLVTPALLVSWMGMH